MVSHQATGLAAQQPDRQGRKADGGQDGDGGIGVGRIQRQDALEAVGDRLAGT